MTLGEFRKRTAELPDDAELIVLNILDGNRIGKSAENVRIIPPNSTIVNEERCRVEIPGYGIGLQDCFLVNEKSEITKMDFSKTLVIVEGECFYIGDFDE